MIEKLKKFLYEKFAGKLAARAAVTIAAFLAGDKVQSVLALAGIHIQIDQEALSAGMVLAGHAAYEWLKHKTNPQAPAPAPEAAK